MEVMPSASKKEIDYALVCRAIAGDQQAYQDLMNRYRNAVFHLMYKKLNNREDADDLTQEAFSKAFNKLHTYTPTYAFSTWLFKIANNNCIDHIRRKKIRTCSIDEPIQGDSKKDYSDHIRADILNPEQVVMHGQKIEMVRRVIGELSFKYRLMIEMRFFEEMSYEEIATELGIPLGTVKAQLFRAKEMMRDLLQKPGPSAYLESTKVRKKRKKVVRNKRSSTATKSSTTKRVAVAA